MTGTKRTLFWIWQWCAPNNHLLSGLQCLKLWLYLKAKKPLRIFLKRSLPRSLLLEYRMVNIYILCVLPCFHIYWFFFSFFFCWFVSLDPPFDLNLPSKYWRKNMYWFLRIMALEIGDLVDIMWYLYILFHVFNYNYHLIYVFLSS